MFATQIIASIYKSIETPDVDEKQSRGNNVNITTRWRNN